MPTCMELLPHTRTSDPPFGTLFCYRRDKVHNILVVGVEEGGDVGMETPIGIESLLRSRTPQARYQRDKMSILKAVEWEKG